MDEPVIDLPPRPDGVPEDWVRVGCMNPICTQMVWVPRMVTPGTQVINICSDECTTYAVAVQYATPEATLNALEKFVSEWGPVVLSCTNGYYGAAVPPWHIDRSCPPESMSAADMISVSTDSLPDTLVALILKANKSR